MIEADRVGLENIASACCKGIYAVVNFAGVERGVVKVADDEGYGVCGRWQEVATPTHKLLSEGHVCVEA